MQYSTVAFQEFLEANKFNRQTKNCNRPFWICLRFLTVRVMLQLQLVVVHLALVITLLQRHSSSMLLAEAVPEPLEPSAALGMEAHPTASEEKAASNLAAKLFLLDELVSLENEVTETKKKRSFPGFGSPIDRISATSVDTKGKQRKVVELPKRRFGIPLDRIGVSRLGNTKGSSVLND
nr:osteocrin isoform X1 [Anas platyrhynchos]